MTVMNLHRYPSPSGGIALGKMGVGATLLKQGATAKDYVQNGLIWILDGLENSLYGKHDAISGNYARWNNLIDGGTTYFRPAWNGGLVFHENYVSTMQKTQNNDYGGYCPSVAIQFEFGSAFVVQANHIEVVFSCPDTITASTVFFGGYLQNGIGIGRGYIGTGANVGYSISNNEVVSLSFNADYRSSTYYKNGINNPVPQSVVSKSTGGVNNWTLFGGGYKQTFDNKYFCLRFYNRALTASEIAANYEIDKERFNLP